MKIAVAKMKAKLANKKPVDQNARTEESAEEEHCLEVDEVPEADEERGPQPAVDQTYHEDEELPEIKFIKGNKGSKNPGKLILGNKQQFICNKQIKVGERKICFYICSRKHEGRGKGKGATCNAKLSLEMNEVGEEVDILTIPKLTDHNHVCDEARIVKWLLLAEMENEMLKDVLQKASSVRKRVIVAYQQKYKDKT